MMDLAIAAAGMAVFVIFVGLFMVGAVIWSAGAWCTRRKARMQR